MYIPQDRNVIYHYIISYQSTIFFGRYTNNYEDVAGQNWFGAQPEVFSVSFAHFRAWQGGSTYTGNLYFFLIVIIVVIIIIVIIVLLLTIITYVYMPRKILRQKKKASNSRVRNFRLREKNMTLKNENDSNGET